MAPVKNKLSELRMGPRKLTRFKPPTSHTTAEWNEIKPAFTRLYIGERRPLKEVQRILKQKHNFAATEKMLKTHITRWKIGKNRNERENHHALRIFWRERKEGHRVSMRIREQPTTLEDALKHFTKKGIVDEDDLRDRLPKSPTPSTISYTVENSDEVACENEDLESTSHWHRSSHQYDEGFEVGDSRMLDDSTLAEDVPYVSAHDNRTHLFHNNQSDETLARQLQRRLTLEDGRAWTNHDDPSSDIFNQLKNTVLQHLEDLLTMTLNGVRPKPPDFGPKCKGKAILNDFTSAVQKKDAVEAVACYDRGLDMMDEMTKTFDPFSIVYICELMRIALVSNNEAMPMKMLHYVSKLESSDHPLPLLVSSVMQATGDDSTCRGLLDLVYCRAMERAISTPGVEKGVIEALNRRYAIFCSQG